MVPGQRVCVSLVFIAAEPREFRGILRHAADIERLSWEAQWARRARLNGRTAVFVANGPGPKLAASAAEAALKKLENVDAFISTGFCGALTGGLNVADVFIAETVNREGVNIPQCAGNNGAGLRVSTRMQRPQVPRVVHGNLISEDRVACTVEEKSALGRTGANAVEMEAAGVAAVARRASVPFYCVRVVTDAADQPLPLDFNALRDAQGRFSTLRILLSACRRPARTFPELMKLDRACKRASIALGDFLANCRF